MTSQEEIIARRQEREAKRFAEERGDEYMPRPAPMPHFITAVAIFISAIGAIIGTAIWWLP